MKHVLVGLISQLTEITEEETLAIEESYPIKTYEKGTFLLKKGQVGNDAYFVIEGCVRKYSIFDGEEMTIDFYTEDDTIVDLNTVANKNPSKNFYVCSENSTLAIINSEKEKTFYKRFPRFESICRVEFEKMMGKIVDAIESNTNRTPEERYLHLLEERPGLINRVPQYQIASYLGMTPETLSRVRKKMFDKQKLLN